MTASHGLDCEEAHRFIDDFVDKQLDATTRQQFVEHICNCPDCKCYLDQYSSTIDLCKCDGKVDPPAELVESTIEFLRARGLGNA